MGWNRAGLSEHREKRVIGKMITPLRQGGTGIALPLGMLPAGSSAPALRAVDGGKCCSIKGSKVQAPVNTPDEPMSCLWMFRKQKKLN